MTDELSPPLLLYGFLQNVTNCVGSFHDVHEAVLAHHTEVGEVDGDAEAGIQRIDLVA